MTLERRFRCCIRNSGWRKRYNIRDIIFMIDISSLPLFSKVILNIGFTIGFISFVLVLRYPIILILMKYSPEYREFIKRTIARKKKKLV